MLKIRKQSLLCVFTFVAFQAFSQLEFVYSNKYSQEELGRIFEYPLHGNEPIKLDSSNLEDFKRESVLGLAWENDVDRNAFDANPSIYETVSDLYVTCRVPSNIYNFKNVKSIIQANSEICGLSDLHVFMSDSVLELDKLKTINFEGGSPWFIYENLGSVPSLKEFNCTVQFLPFSLLTNKSVKRINGSGTNPELEMFRQLGFETNIPDYFAEEKFKPPYTPVDQLEKRKMKGGELELYYLNGNKLVVGKLVSDVLDGKWQLWYPDGTLCETRHYANGIPSGQWQFFEESGDTMCIIDHVDGKPYRLTLIDEHKDSIQGTFYKGITVITDFTNPNRSHAVGRQEKTQYYNYKSYNGYYSEYWSIESIGMRIIVDSKIRKDSAEMVVQEYAFIGYRNGNIENPQFKQVNYYNDGRIKDEKYYMEYWIETSVGRSHVLGPHGMHRKWDESGKLILEEEYVLGEKIE